MQVEPFAQTDSQEHPMIAPIPVKMYRTEDRLMIAAPMPGMLPEDIVVEVTSDGSLILHGRLRGYLKGVKEVLLDEWTVGGYHRELALSDAVDGSLTNVTYGNGVLTRPAKLTLETVAPDIGQRVGSAGHPPHPIPASAL
jgi:HSP20 family protein